ncbi:MAG: General secretion pathway protein F [Parcubacteria bacterium C7867-001]|nr:MAG: General secretion pathway protein F [Parcubacteria bacterium C7867-001]
MKERFIFIVNDLVARARRVGIEKEAEYLTQNLGLLLSSGVDVVSALKSIEAGVKHPEMRRIIAVMRSKLAEGNTLAQAFEESGAFSPRVATLIRIGEESGQLVEHFSMIGVQEEKQRELTGKVQSALLYPVFVLLVTAMVGIGVSWFILPKLARVFTQLKLQLPFITQMILGFGKFLGQYGAIALPLGALLFAVLVYIIFFYPATRRIGETILWSIPGIRTLIQEVELSRLGFVFGGLLKSGVPILESIELLRGSTSMTRYQALYAHLGHRVSEGDSLAQAFASFPRFNALVPAPVEEIIVTGSQSGHLADVLTRVGKAYEEKSDVSSRNLAIILEPLLLFIIWIAVVLVALGVILPIYNLVGSINHH